MEDSVCINAEVLLFCFKQENKEMEEKNAKKLFPICEWKKSGG